MRLPPLQLLPAFDAAARHLSFSKAARELHLTTSAISQQIKQLEAQLGMPLFRRLTRRVELTEAGHEFALVAAKTLGAYRSGHAAFVQKFARAQLRLSMTPLIANEFVIPRIQDFQSAHPELSLSIESSMDLVDFDQEPIDAAVRVGAGQWPGLESWLLCECVAVALAAPSLLAAQPIRRIDDLVHHTLIRRRQEQFGWADLARLMQMPGVSGRNELLVDSDLAALNAAQRGQGVTLSFLPAGVAPSALWPEDQLRAVMPPFKTSLKAWFVFRPNDAKADLLREVFAWIREQIAPSRDTDS